MQFKAIPTNQRIPAIQDGQVDMVVRTMTINCDRLEEVAFSAPYFQTGQQLLAPKTSADHRVRRDAGRQEDLHGGGFHRLDTLDADQKDGRLAAAADFGTHRAQPTRLPGAAPARRGRRGGHRRRAGREPGRAGPDGELKGEPFTTEYYGVAMKKDADDLVRRVNRVLVDYRKADGWQKSYDEWLPGPWARARGPPAAQSSTCARS